MVSWRLAFRWGARAVRPPHRLLIVGTSDHTLRVARELFDRREELGVEIVGFIDPDPSRVGTPLFNPSVIGSIADIPSLVGARAVDRVVLGLSDERGKLPMEEFLAMRVQGIRFEPLASLYEVFTGKIAVENLRPSWLIFSSGFRKSRLALAGKRLLDLLFAGGGLLLASPLLAAAAIAVRVSSPGPILFHQRRVGQHGRVFTVHKFRSMRIDAESGTGAVWASEDDPRATRVGRLLRRTRIDEIPQLWNVLVGDMSLVGPRPERPEFVADLARQIPFYDQRHVVKPGVTGWAQVRYSYGATISDALEKLQYQSVLHQAHVTRLRPVHRLRDGQDRPARTGLPMTPVPGSPGVVNALTIDVEDYFHANAFDHVVTVDEWPRLESRVCANTERLLGLLDEAGVRATFFVVGWVAERFPALVRQIAAGHHELASHSYRHRLVYHLTPAEFREDLRRARAAIESAAQVPIRGYRAPSYSVTARSLWALDILAEEGYAYDASIFPVHHDRYGIPHSPRHAYVVTAGEGSILEIPGSTARWGSLNIPVGGGGYFRLLPYAVTRWGITQINVRERRPAIFYLHPWELDPNQPRLPVGQPTRWRHYHNLDRTEARFRRLLGEFRFDTIAKTFLETPVRAVETHQEVFETRPDRDIRRAPTQSGVPREGHRTGFRGASESANARLARVDRPL